MKDHTSGNDIKRKCAEKADTFRLLTLIALILFYCILLTDPTRTRMP